VPPSAKIKLAGKRKKESRTSRVSRHKEHGNVAHAVTWQGIACSGQGARRGGVQL
jgi:hypothetical protein